MDPLTGVRTLIRWHEKASFLMSNRLRVATMLPRSLERNRKYLLGRASRVPAPSFTRSPRQIRSKYTRYMFPLIFICSNPRPFSKNDPGI